MVDLTYPPGATPLNPDELGGLIPDYISTQGELNALEYDNILEAQKWAFSRKRKEILTDIFLRKLHLQMFKDVWKWAGTYRKSDKSIGVPWSQIINQVVNLCANTQYWIDHLTFGWDELGARFHHQLVSIHPFPNGNGRHARLMTDVLLYFHGQAVFSWGSSSKADLVEKGELRSRYINALREADRRSYASLIAFVRS